MATPILILGEPGTGKTVSTRNLKPEETFFIVSDRKPLTLPGSKSNYKTILKDNGKLDLQKSNYYETADPAIVKALLQQISDNRPDIKNIILDTITSMMTSEYMGRLKEKGFEKFNDLALDTYEIITMLRGLRDDLNIVIMAHTQTSYDSDGIKRTSFKVPGGKLIGQNIEPEALFHIVLYTDVVMTGGKAEYRFLTQNNGKNTCRTPYGLFSETYIPNDLADVIAEYHDYAA
jgi:hypothetical protein